MKTVFVVGAGASKEVNLPTGVELKKVISDSLQANSHGGQPTIWEAFTFLSDHSDHGSYKFEQFAAASKHIREAMHQAVSIDNFLNAHPNDKLMALCGKCAIVHAILKAESNSSIFVGSDRHDRLEFSQVENTWLSYFMQWLSDCRPVDLERRLSSIVMIIFNYDRCVEHYIYHWLKSYYGLDPATAGKLLNRIEIYHPYGTVGPLPSPGGDDGIKFGAMPHSSNIPILAGKIKTFTEGTDEESSDIVAIRQHMETALRLIFLGFAFHQMNMDLLQSGPPIRNRKVFATCHGLSSSKTEMISRGFSMPGPFIGDSGIHFRNVACNQLFREFSHYFSPE